MFKNDFAYCKKIYSDPDNINIIYIESLLKLKNNFEKLKENKQTWENKFPESGEFGVQLDKSPNWRDANLKYESIEYSLRIDEDKYVTEIMKIFCPTRKRPIDFGECIITIELE